jgi:ribonucleoside-triphosphate reductase
MYPDYISLTGYGATADIYTRYNGIERVFDESGKEVVECKIADGYLDGRLVPLDDPRRKEAKYSHGNPQVAISSMGCRSFLSPWYAHNDKNIKTKIKDVSKLDRKKYTVHKATKLGYVRYTDKATGYTYTTDVKDHFYPIFEEEVPIYEGRQNNGVITLHLMLIFQYCRNENKDFFQVLSYYMEMIRKLHLRSIEFNGKKKASINPYAFMYGGLIDSHGKPTHKKPSDDIASVLACGTTSFGITGLNELQVLYNGQTIRQAMQEKLDSIEKYGADANKVKIPFCEKVVDFINNKIAEYKDEDGVLHSLYGTPAEKLSGTQMEQFKAMFPNIRVKGVTDNTWVSNSFHIHVAEDITPSEKQDLEFDLFHKVNGGHIQYVRINGSYNHKAIGDIIRRGMRYGFYQGVNMDLSFCDDCGYHFDSHNMEICECPKCKSKRISTSARICGYLGWTRRGEFYEEDENGKVIHNGNRINLPMVDNIKARKCM